MAVSEAADVERFRAAIGRCFGLSFDESKLGFLAEVLERRTSARGVAAAHYLDRIEGPTAQHEELGELARELTVGETYFFRHLDQFRAFAEVALPDRTAVRSNTRRLRLLSAGCSSGDEAYSLAILLRERGLDPGWDISVHAVDLNPGALERAARARYSSWSLRETPLELQRRWFVADAREFILDPAIRSAVTVEERNLTLDDPSFWRPERFDVVFCRNVIMYFTPEIAQRLIARIATALAPGGYLFLGHAETLRGLSHDFHLRHTHETFYYQRKDAHEPVSERMAPLEIRPRLTSSPPVDTGWTATWIETVRRTTDRIKALREPAPDLGSARSYAKGRMGVDLSVAVELLKEERFADALHLLEDLPVDAVRDPDVSLLRAVLLTHSGDLEHARRLCAGLIELDEFSAGAHYLLALCAEGAGERHSAIDHDQTAAYLDPAFAMPRLHLGLMARRAGDRETAQRELGQAILLLGVEDASRLLLFGGGFSRDGLIALCRAELGGLGGRP